MTERGASASTTRRLRLAERCSALLATHCASFGPVASLVPYDDFDEALRLADATEYGLQAAVFTRDIDSILTAMKRLNFGGLIINDVPSFRAEHMPYGGNRQSGLGREGVRFAMEEMTNIQMVAIRSSRYNPD